MPVQPLRHLFETLVAMLGFFAFMDLRKSLRDGFVFECLRTHSEAVCHTVIGKHGVESRWCASPTAAPLI